jgi:hypothetical protein
MFRKPALLPSSDKWKHLIRWTPITKTISFWRVHQILSFLYMKTQAAATWATSQRRDSYTMGTAQKEGYCTEVHNAVQNNPILKRLNTVSVLKSSFFQDTFQYCIPIHAYVSQIVFAQWYPPPRSPPTSVCDVSRERTFLVWKSRVLRRCISSMASQLLHVFSKTL